MRPGVLSKKRRPFLNTGLAGIGVAVTVVLATAGLAPAQQTAPPPGGVQGSVGPASVDEEAPPAVVQAPPPAVAPPVAPSQVAPAAPPERRVAEKPTESVRQRPRFDVAVLQAVDKVTAETIRFEAPVGQPVRYGSIVLTVRACESTAADEPMEDTVAYISVESQPLAQSGRPSPGSRQIFRGWIYASSPSLNGLEHPIYDAWLITCRTSAPLRTAEDSIRPSTASASDRRSR